ncbi:hypothetical protein OY671_009002, partial [Metschnikowia pulcherrima]
PFQGQRGAGAACPGGPQAVPCRDPAHDCGSTEPHRCCGRGGGLADAGRRCGRHRSGQRRCACGRCGRAMYGHLPRRAAVSWRGADGWWPHRRKRGAPAGHAAARCRPADGAAEDGHTTPAGRPHDRSGAVAGAAQRRRAVDDVSADAGAHGATGVSRDRAHQCAHARYHPQRAGPFAAVHGRDRRAGAALLPIDRGQDPPLRRSRRAPGLSRTGGAGRPHGLPERGQHLAADGC